MRIAVFTLEALAAAEAVSRFIDAEAHRIVLVGLSDPYRPAMGGMFGQTWRHVRRSGLGFLPYLVANFTLPEIAGRLGRGPELPHQAARRHGIATQKITDVNAASVHATLQRLHVDLLVSFHFDQIFTAATLAVPALGGVNIHPSLLPLHRGPVPTLHALADRGPFGVTVHRLAPRIDAGGILAQAEIALPKGASSIAAAAAAHLAALTLLPSVLADVEASQEHPLHPAVQPYRGFPTRQDISALRGKGGASNLQDWRAALARRQPA